MLGKPVGVSGVGRVKKLSQVLPLHEAGGGKPCPQGQDSKSHGKYETSVRTLERKGPCLPQVVHHNVPSNAVVQWCSGLQKLIMAAIGGLGLP